MEIKLDNEGLATIATAAIFDSMTQQARDDVVRQALQYLLTPEKNRNTYGVNTTTPLQDAFNAGIRTAAFRAVEEKIQNDPEVQNHIYGLLGPLLNSAMEAEAEDWNSGLADALGSALGAWLSTKARERSNR